MATRDRSGRRTGGRWAILGFALAIGLGGAASAQEREEGRDLFLREWVPGRPSERGGDGLGPLYNDSSCVACHNQGGVGGGGPESKNIRLVTAVLNPVSRGGRRDEFAEIQRKHRIELARIRGAAPPPPPRTKGQAADRAPLIALHRGFGEAASITLHRFGPDVGYDGFRWSLLDPDVAGLFDLDHRAPRFFRSNDEARALQFEAGKSAIMPFEHGHFTIIPSERNPIALFGAGLIDAIPDEAIERAAERANQGVFPLGGRVARLKDGRIGRFGWKAQAASLDDFVRTACAVELGLEVPGHSQASDPRKPAAKAPGLDLTSADCDALTEFVRALPSPERRIPARPEEAVRVVDGERLFAEIGCASCHTPALGGVNGLYSDLLLHDLGDELGDSGSYDRVPPSRNGTMAEDDGLPPAFPSALDAFVGGTKRTQPADRQEWRTPPLWGLRDSAPYLHDGRAATLEQAIALHEGKGSSANNAFFRLGRDQRADVIAFLKSLVAPEPMAQGRTRPVGPERNGG